ncbi:hypothetical protein ISF_09689 [Cordyceps fumosorosea ARSEF 2679]|uniref:Uncharacterized protein n=1 Tax=Cordyceps fumosorosea (strain ARSEF 2679) TaxID=1081104 RepID=A0A162JJW0_CORFA|nr:hypothetical protein ISF_09689 [Cordyceps fumosorosea ARSEF 2679]OAA43063.1 hypothetical protein ISF_09689 [Cordyceps fumosorosea ARSEF 2679]
MGNERDHYNDRHVEHGSDKVGGLLRKYDPFSNKPSRQCDPIHDQGDGHGRFHGHLHDHHCREEYPTRRKRAYPDRDLAESHRRSRNNHESHSKRHCGGIPYGQAIASAALAGAVEAVSARHDKDKALHVATAAAASAAADAAIGSKGDAKSARHVAESTITGLAMDRLLNGKRKK